MAAVGLGIGRGAIDAFYDLANGKRSSAGSNTPLAERPMVQVNVARAEGLLLSARSFFHETARDVWANVLAGKTPDAQQLATTRLARINAIAASAQAIDLVCEAGGGGTIYATCPIERCLRDTRTARQHVSMAAANYGIVGRVLLGLTPDRPVNHL